MHTLIKAVRVHVFGGPEVMKIEEVELPPPAKGEAAVRIHAAGVNFIDTYFRTGSYKPPTMPFIPGAEAAGTVEALGEGTEGLKEGDRVAFAGSLGCYAERRNIPTNSLVKLPDSISFEIAAAMMLKGLTAQYLLRQTIRVKAGDTILVHAAAGGVGLILCQWAKELGATVIGTVGTKDKAVVARHAGVEHVILYREEDFVERVKSITKGRLCDVVYDGVGKATFPASLDCLRPRGLLASFGSASGKIETFDITLLSQKGSLYVTRPTLATYTADPGNLQKMAAELFQQVADGTIKIEINATQPLANVVAVHRALEARKTTGSTVLTI